MTVDELLDAAGAAGIAVTVDDGRLVIRASRSVAGLAREVHARSAEILQVLTMRANPCCGERPVGQVGASLVLSCQLCPNSPTYWRHSP